MAESEQNAVRLVLKEVLRDGEVWRSGLRNQRPESAVGDGKLFDPLTARDLDRHLSHGKRGRFRPGEAIRTRPPRREVRLSSLWCMWDFGSNDARCSFYLGMWFAGDSGQAGNQHRRNDGRDASGDLRFAGFRFESPGSGGNHDYYHSQPCRTMCHKGAQIRGALPLPERHPAWPLPAQSALDLLLCTIVSFRGLAGTEAIYEDNGPDTDPVIRNNRLIRDAYRRIRRLRRISTS